MKRLAVLGCTGSIGRSTLSVVESFPDRFQVVSMAAGHNLDVLRAQLSAHRPKIVCVADSDDARSMAAEFPGTRWVSGKEGLIEVACQPSVDTVVAALVGSIGLESTLAAIQAGKNVALANKETLVVAGQLVMQAVEEHGVELLPVDSEHNALHQALRVGPPEAVKRLILTASGGPFRTSSKAEIRNANRALALDHPTWKMGPKITIDSATMMNKGLEVIEARHLFDIAEQDIAIVVHPQSLVHSLAEYVDGTLIAQLAVNDMRFPIMYALAWPERLVSPLPRLSLADVGKLTFEDPDEERFPALRLAREALRAGGEMPAVLNAANEVAVEAFLADQIKLGTIGDAVETALERHAASNTSLTSLDQALAADREGRRLARQFLEAKINA